MNSRQDAKPLRKKIKKLCVFVPLREYRIKNSRQDAKPPRKKLKNFAPLRLCAFARNKTYTRAKTLSR
jgi:hypothetical protein